MGSPTTWRGTSAYYCFVSVLRRALRVGRYVGVHAHHVDVQYSEGRSLTKILPPFPINLKNTHSRFGRMFEQRFYAVVGRNAKDGWVVMQ